ncbi:MAG: hypothetical protein E7580_07005 [Ruminococcaceae bacterium]|nr:hypothetical protein [Oscillospiraceae bacterium]
MEKSKTNFFKKNIPIIAILFILGIIFLGMSEYDFNKNDEKSGVDFDERAYTKDLEDRLSAMLEEMEGVENVRVMITLDSSSRYRFAQQESATLQGSTYVSSYLTQDLGSGSKEPILIEVGSPKIKGVSVVCRGAENILIREKIIGLISGTLNLTKNKIYVTE